MNTAELKEYLGMVLDVEKNIYLQQSLITSLSKEIDNCSVSYSYSEPIAPSAPSYKDPADDIKAGFVMIGIGLLAGFIGGVLGSSVFVFGIILAITTIIFLFMGAIFLFLGALTYSDNKKKETKKLKYYNEALATYKRDYDAYQKNVAMEKKRQQENSRKIISLRRELDELNEQHLNSQRTLEQLYAKGIIFPKYRNLIMVSSLYEYICAGRCKELEGHEGAYNILEMEIRLDRVITQLDRIIAQLDSIKQNQFMLYSAIQESNQQSARLLKATDQMVSSLQDFHGELDELNSHICELQKTSALTAYCAERSRKELAYMNRMNYLAGRNDDVFWNVPPT